MSEKFSVVIKSNAYQSLINSTLGDKEVARKFVADISAIVSNNPLLSDCDPATIVSGGLMATTLNLSLSPSIGQAYLVPFASKKGRVAQFQVGYKGFIQMAIRSRQFLKIGCNPVHDGEYLGQDENGDDVIKFANHQFDSKPVVGYRAYFVLTNGFAKSLYMTRAQITAHATRYSQSYSRSGGVWKTNFDEMAMKTVLKQLISKWAPLSIDFQKAIEADQAVLREGLKPEYVDNADAEPEAPAPTKKSTVANALNITPEGEVAPIPQAVNPEPAEPKKAAPEPKPNPTPKASFAEYEEVDAFGDDPF